jgi:hypothetical protein
MARFEVGYASTATVTVAPICDIRTGSTREVFLREMGFFCNAATASAVGLYRQATVGTASTTIVPVAVNGADAASLTLIGTAWSSAPTISTNVPLRKLGTAASVGAGAIWTWWGGDGLRIPVSSSLVLWNFSGATNSVLNGYFVFDE